MKRITPEQHIESFFGSATLMACRAQLDIIGAIMRVRFPETNAARKPRKAKAATATVTHAQNT